MFDGRFELLCPSVRGTRSRTAYRERLLLRESALPCAPTYNRGFVQHVVFDRFGLAQRHECSSKPATCKHYCARGLQKHLRAVLNGPNFSSKFKSIGAKNLEA